MNQMRLSKLHKAPGVLRRRLHFRLRPWTYRVNQLFPGAIRLSSSQTDRPDYIGICEKAVNSDAFFVQFKRHPDYQVVLEHVSQAQGQEYLNVLLQRDDELLNHAVLFAKNDTVGNPYTYHYSIGRFSPTTLRYMKVLSDLHRSFGSLERMRIVEIGPAYGGQCVVTSLGGGFASYTGIDLPASLRLMKKYVHALEVQSVQYQTQAELVGRQSYDLAISNYAISECRRGIQDAYIQSVLQYCKRGYITYNAVDRPLEQRFEWTPYGLQEFVQNLSQYHSLTIEEEVPQTGKKTPNMLITWNET